MVDMLANVAVGGGTGSPSAGDSSSEDSYSTSVHSENQSPLNTTTRKYDRKNKRFAWPDDLHRLFVAAVFDLGLANASPKALLPFMEPAASAAGLTSEHIKSHLQKYRLHHDRSRAEFLAFYDEAAAQLGRRRRRGSPGEESHTKFIFPVEPPKPMADAAMAAATPPSGYVNAMVQAQENLIRQGQAQLLMQQAMALAAQASQSMAPHMMQQSMNRANVSPMQQHQQQNAAMAAGSMGNHDVIMQNSGNGMQWDPSIGNLFAEPPTAMLMQNSIEDGVAAMSFQDHGVPPVLREQMHAVMQEHRQILSKKGEVTERWGVAGAQMQQQQMGGTSEPNTPPMWGSNDIDMDMDDPDELFRFLRQSDD